MNDEQLLRYNRQIMLPDFDVEGQEKLLASRALIIGMGGLGAPAAIYLAAAGIGSLVICDDDQVDLSNLQRQIIHRNDSVGQPKVDSARNTLEAINPSTVIETIDHRLDEAEYERLVSGCDVVLDATDNFSTRYTINAVCWHSGVPLVSGAAVGWEGQVAVFDPRLDGAPCYRCLYPDGEDGELNCAENGVIAPLVGIIGTCQAMEAIKVVTGVGDTLAGFVLYFDGKRMDWRKLKLTRNPDCRTCGS